MHIYIYILREKERHAHTPPTDSVYVSVYA